LLLIKGAEIESMSTSDFINSQSDHARLRAVALGRTTIEGGFWAGQMHQARPSAQYADVVERVIAHPFVSQLQGRVALQRGPLLYCAEGVDNSGNMDVVLAADPQFRDDYRADVLGGVVTLVGRTQDGGTLRAVPYYAWDNRQPRTPPRIGWRSG
jgi:DUF1680 family protein